jgi:hypothetical protein
MTALSLSSAQVIVHAQTSEDRAAARGLAEEGAKLLASGNASDALDRFERAEKLLHAPPHLLYAARAQVKLGRLVAAKETYLQLTREVLAPGASKAFTDAQAAGKTELDALVPRIASLHIAVTGAPAGATVVVKLDGVVVPPALVGANRPTDPGDHVLTATAPGYEATAKVTLAEGATESTTLELKSNGTATTTTTTTTTTKTTDPTETPKPKDEGTSGGGLRTVGWVTSGVGVVGVGLGIFFGTQVTSKVNDANSHCVGTVCPASAQATVSSLADDARSARTLSYIMFGVGAVALATGVTLIIVGGPKKSEATSSPTVSATFTPSWIGLSGKF